MWKVEAESSAKTISLEDLLAGDVSWRCECVGQTSCRNFCLVLGSLGGGGQAVRSTMKMMCNIRHIKVTAGWVERGCSVFEGRNNIRLMVATVRCICPSLGVWEPEGELHCIIGVEGWMRRVISSDSVNLDEIEAAGMWRFKYMSSSQIWWSVIEGRCINLAGRGAIADDSFALLNGKSGRRLRIPT